MFFQHNPEAKTDNGKTIKDENPISLSVIAVRRLPLLTQLSTLQSEKQITHIAHPDIAAYRRGNQLIYEMPGNPGFRLRAFPGPHRPEDPIRIYIDSDNGVLLQFEFERRTGFLLKVNGQPVKERRDTVLDPLNTTLDALLKNVAKSYKLTNAPTLSKQEN